MCSGLMVSTLQGYDHVNIWGKLREQIPRKPANIHGGDIFEWSIDVAKDDKIIISF